MATRVLVLVGSKKGAFILESDAARSTWSLRGPFCETWPMNHVIADPGERGDLRRRRQCVVRPGGLEIHRSWGELDAFERRARLSGRGRIRSSRCGAGQAVPAGSMPASSRPACFAATMAARLGEHVAGLRNHPSRPQWQPGGAGLILHSLVPHPQDGEPNLGRHIVRGRVPHGRRRGKPGRRATAARAATSCPRGSDTRNSASACIAW